MVSGLYDLPPWFLSLLLLPFGLVVGSFGNVLIHRLPQEDPADRNVVTKASHCPGCRAPIAWYQNIPLVSWLLLRGRCPKCGWRIPFRYFLVELLGGLVAAGSVWVFPFGTLVWAKGLLCGWALLVLFFTDFTEYILPDAVQFPMMVLGLLLTLPQLVWPEALVRIWTPDGGVLAVDAWANALQPAPAWTLVGPAVSWRDSLIGIAAGYGGPWLFERLYVHGRNLVGRAAGWRPIEAGMGMGDFKMLAWLGAFWGWQAMLMILFLGAGLALAVGLPVALVRLVADQPRVNRTLRAFGHGTRGALAARIRRNLMQYLLPFGCALALATFPVVFYGPAVWAWYLARLG